MNFDKKVKGQLIEQLEKRFDGFLDKLNQENLEDASKKLIEDKKSFFINNKVRIPEVAEKIINVISKSQIDRVINSEDLNGISIREDGSNFYLTKDDVDLCQLNAIPKVSDFFKDDVVPQFSCELNSSGGKGFFDYKEEIEYKIYKNIYSDILTENMSKCLEPIEQFKKYLDFFSYTPYYQVISGIDDINKVDLDTVKTNSMKLNVENAILDTSENFDIDENLKDKLESYFSEYLRKAFNIKNNDSLESIFNKSKKIKETIKSLNIDSGSIEYDHSLYEYSEEDPIKDFLFSFQDEENEDEVLYAFIPYDIELDSIINLAVYKLKDDADGCHKSDFLKTDLNLSNYSEQR